MELVDGLYSLAHILYMGIAFFLILFMGIWIKLHVKDEKKIENIIRISGIILILTVMTMRVSETVYGIQMNYKNYSWYRVLPETFCSFSSLTLGIASALGKKNNKVLHFAVFMALYGGFLSVCYPDWLEYEPFFSVRGFTSLLHHTISVWICFLMLLTSYVIPSYKNLIGFTIGYGGMLLLGVFEIYVLKFDTAMNLNEPLLSSMPILTSWWFLYIAAMAVNVFFTWLTKYFYEKSNKTAIE